MNETNILFFEQDLDSQLRIRQQKCPGVVDAIPKDEFLASSNEELLSYVLAKLTIEPLSIREDAIQMSQEETQVDVSRDPIRAHFPGRTGPSYIPGTRVDVYIPFTGEDWIFRYRTNPWSLSSPRGVVDRNRVRVTFSLPHDADGDKFKPLVDRELRLIREGVERSCNQVVKYNSQLPEFINQAIQHRRDRLARHSNIAKILDIPVVLRSGAPSITPVRVAKREMPRLAVPPKTGFAPEPGIADETYEHILHFVRHQGRTFERTPATYAMHGEEDLRNIVLAHLNGHFEGDAVGEVFRRRGKTDICIEEKSRCAFVGECKLWTGPAALSLALDQLLGYLTWRDSKACLVIFNTKNKSFTKILKAVPDTVFSHPLFLRELDCSEDGEWRVQMRSTEDEGRRVIVHIFAFNLFQ